MEPFLAVGAFVGFVVTAAFVSSHFEKKRREALRAWAEQRGWSFEAVLPDIPIAFEGFKLSSRGDDRVLKHHCRGARDGLELRLADYRFFTGAGKNRHEHRQTVCLVTTPGRPAPPFFIRRQRAVLDAVGKAFGGQDLNFDDDPAFSKGWVLQTSGSEAEVRRLFTPALREAFTRLVDPNLVLECDGEGLLLHRERLLKPTELEALVADAVNLRRHWR